MRRSTIYRPRRARLNLPQGAADGDGSEIVAGLGRERARTGIRAPRLAMWRRRRFWIPPTLALLALAVLSAARYYMAVAALSDGRAQVVAARQLLTGDLTHLNAARVADAQVDLQRAADDFGGKSQILQDGWLAWAGSHVPWFSTQIDGARALRAAGESGARLGIAVLQVVHDVVPGGDRPKSSSPLQRLVTLAGQHPDELTRAAGDVNAFEQKLAAVPSAPLFGPLENARQTLLREGNKLVAGAGPALQLLQAIPAAIGPGSHSYLLLLENPAEERPSGGYIGAVGEVTFTNGAVSHLSFRGSEYYTPLVTNIPAPAPLAAHLFGTHPWELDDANWSADFPTAMADVERFYHAATGKSVDGVMSVDPVALGYILGVIGPVHVPPYPQVLTAGNILKELNYITNKARPQDPGKVFLPPFGELITRDLLQAPISQMPPLSMALGRGALEKHIALFFHNQVLERLVIGAGFGGQLTTPTSDSVFVDDANLSGNKSDLFVTRTMRLSVKVDSNGNADDQLTLTYTNPRVTARADLGLLRNVGAEYRDYVRVYLPETATLSSLTVSVNRSMAVPNAPESVTYGFGQEAIALWIVLPRAATEQITLRYSGPFADISVTPERYQLDWIKQVNSLTWPVDVTVRMPDGHSTHWAAGLASDKTWSVTG